MSYIIVSRWAPRVPGTGPGWVGPTLFNQMADNAAILRGIVPDDPRTDSELQALIEDYLVKFNNALYLLGSVGYLHRRFGDHPENVVITAMSFMSQEDYELVQNNPLWAGYIAARNTMIDMLGVNLETKHYLSSDATLWDQFAEKTSAEMSVLFDAVTDTVQHNSYP